MKKTFSMCMGMALCLLAVLFTGCDKDKDKGKVPDIEMVYVKGGTF